MFISFVMLTDRNPDFPRAEIRNFLQAYESLYRFEKENSILCRFTRPMKRTADYLITNELNSVQKELNFTLYAKKRSASDSLQKDYQLPKVPSHYSDQSLTYQPYQSV